MTLPHDPDQPGSPPPPAGPWTPPTHPATPPPGVPSPPMQGYTVPGTWSAPAWLPPRPGSVTAAAVITYIQAGISIIVAFGLLALTRSTRVDTVLGSLANVTAGIAVVLSTLYVVAAVQLHRGRNRGFLLGLTIASIAISVIQMLGSAATGTAGRVGSSTLCALVLPVTVLILLLQPATKEWIEANRRLPR